MDTLPLMHCRYTCYTFQLSSIIIFLDTFEFEKFSYPFASKSYYCHSMYYEGNLKTTFEKVY